jgi:hypothetical protein
MELLETADAGLVGHDTLGWLFCVHKTANNNHKIPLFFRAPAKDFREGRDVVADKSLARAAKTASPLRGREAQLSPLRKWSSEPAAGLNTGDRQKGRPGFSVARRAVRGKICAWIGKGIGPLVSS